MPSLKTTFLIIVAIFMAVVVIGGRWSGHANSFPSIHTTSSGPSAQPQTLAPMNSNDPGMQLTDPGGIHPAFSNQIQLKLPK